MIDGPAILTVLVVYIAGVIIPGPNFVAVVHKAVATTRLEALALVGGIVLVNLFWATCAIAGIGVVFAAFPWAALVVKVLGAGYLIWFGWRLWRQAGAHPVTGTQSGAGSFRQAFVQGVVTNIGNPKSMAFFAAVFSAATPTHVSSATFLAMLAVVGCVSSTWYTLVTLALSQPSVSAGYRRGKKNIDRMCGGLIGLLGVRQLVQ